MRMPYSSATSIDTGFRTCVAVAVHPDVAGENVGDGLQPQVARSGFTSAPALGGHFGAARLGVLTPSNARRIVASTLIRSGKRAAGPASGDRGNRGPACRCASRFRPGPICGPLPVVNDRLRGRPAVFHFQDDVLAADCVGRTVHRVVVVRPPATRDGYVLIVAARSAADYQARRCR